MFERGQFTQKLDLVKVFNDPQSLIKQTSNTSALLRGVGDVDPDPETGDQPIQLAGPTDDTADNAAAASDNSDQEATDAEEENATETGLVQLAGPIETDAAATEQVTEGKNVNAAIEEQKANEEDQARIIAEYRTTVAEANTQLASLSAQISTIDAAQNALKSDLSALEASLAAADPEYDNLTEAQIDAKYPEVKALSNKIQAKADERETVKQEVQTVYNSAFPPPSNKVNSTVSYDSNNVPNITLS
jgi:hypothetical protein